MEGAEPWLSISTRGTLLPISNTPSAPPRTAGRQWSEPYANTQWNFMDCARTLYRRKNALCCLAGLGLLAAALFSAGQPRMYRSQASIQIQGVNENFLNLRDIFPTAAPSADNAVYVQTQAEMLQQDSLIEQVVEKLHLENGRNISGTPDSGRRPAGLTRDACRADSRREEVKKNLQVSASRGSSIIRIVCPGARPATRRRHRQYLGPNLHRTEHRGAAAFRAADLHVAEPRPCGDSGRRLLKSEAELGAYGRGSAGILGVGGARKTPRGFLPLGLDVIPYRRGRWQPPVL